MASFVDKAGLSRLWERVKSTFVESATTSSTAITPGSGMIIVTGTYQPTVWRQGNVVVVEGAIRNVSARSSSGRFLIGTLPIEFKPMNEVYRIQRCGTAAKPRSYDLHISATTGGMYCEAILDPTSTDGAAKPANAQEAFYIGCSYIVDSASSSTNAVSELMSVEETLEAI